MSEKKKILIIQKVHQKGMELIENHPNFEVDVTDDTSEESLKAKIQNCDGVSIRIANLSGDVMKEAKNLKIVSRHGVGYDNVDLNYAKEKDIKIAITANANAVTVSEHVFFNLLNISKRKDLFDKTVREGNFKDRNKLPKTIELWKKNFLIVGFGRIGQALIKRCLGFEMSVYVFDPFISKEKIETKGGKKIENLEEAVKSMDVISLHMPLTEKTKNLINYDLLKTMKKNCIIINAARGGIINETDLDKALNEELIFGAGIDVFEKEPPEDNNPLLKNEKVFLSPHTAAFTEECMTRMGMETIQNIIDFFENKIDQSKIVKL
tara:strand:+ start:2962 stop:3927 length:966 start_codon:yes stop_codon:yes gene_type:complete